MFLLVLSYLVFFVRMFSLVSSLFRCMRDGSSTTSSKPVALVDTSMNRHNENSPWACDEERELAESPCPVCGWVDCECDSDDDDDNSNNNDAEHDSSDDDNDDDDEKIRSWRSPAQEMADALEWARSLPPPVRTLGQAWVVPKKLISPLRKKHVFLERVPEEEEDENEEEEGWEKV